MLMTAGASVGRLVNNFDHLTHECAGQEEMVNTDL